MPDIEDKEQDLTLGALESLSEVATTSANELNVLNDELTAMQRRRRRGWTWQQIVSTSSEINPISAVARIALNLGRSSGEFRRSLARALHTEGVRVTDIASIFTVSRQRVSAMLQIGRCAATTNRPGSSPVGTDPE